MDDRAFEMNSINMSVAYASLNISLLQDPHVYGSEDNHLSAAVTGKKGRLKEDEVIVEVRGTLCNLRDGWVVPVSVGHQSLTTQLPVS